MNSPGATCWALRHIKSLTKGRTRMTPTLGQMRKLIEQTDNANLSLEDMKYLLEEGLYTDLLRFAGNPALRERRNAKEIRLAVQKIFGLSALFATPAEQLAMFIEINKQQKLRFDERHFEALGATPTEETQDLVVWTLEAMLSDPKETFDKVRWLIKSPFGRGSVETSCDISGVAPGCEWKPMTLRWVKIDLGADLGKTANEGTCSQSAHIGPMWQAVYSPNWFASIGQKFDGLEIPEVSLPGFRINYSPEGGVPHLEPTRIRQHTILRSYTNSQKGQAALARYIL